MTEPSPPPDRPAGSPWNPETSGPPQGTPGAFPPYPPQGYPPQGYPPPPAPPPGSWYPPPYPYASYGPPPVAERNGLGTGALIASVASLPAAFTVFGGFILAIAGIVLGIMGYNRARRGEATNPGIAIAGIVVGVLGVILSVALVALGIWGFYKVGGVDYVDCIQRAGSDTVQRMRCEEQFRDSLHERLSVTPTPPR
jgi:Domain of unknown function (DUF4190)